MKYKITNNINFNIMILLFINLVNVFNVAIAIDNNSDEFSIEKDWQDCTFDLNKANRLCRGFYKEPEYPLKVTKNHPKDTLIINSDHTKFISKGLSNFTGNVVVTKGDQQLNANKLLVQQNPKGQIESLAVEGKAKLIEPGFRIIGQDLKVMIDNNYKEIKDANYRIYSKHATGDSEKIEIFSDQILQMPNATYSTCNPKQQTWKIKAKKVKIDKTKGMGEMWDGKLYVKEVPIFYYPYVRFPIDHKRHSGFLSPSLNNTSNHGLILGIPWYWNMAPNYDYTITPFFMSKRGTKINNQFRYLTINSLGLIGFNFLIKDKAYRNFIDRQLNNNIIPVTDPRYLKLKNRNLRYGLWYKNITKLTNHLNLYLHYNRVSDSNYLRDFGKDLGQSSFSSLPNIVDQSHKNLISSNGSGLEEVLHSSSLHLEQSARLENINRSGTLNINLSKYKTLYPFVDLNIENQYKRLPEINWNSNEVNFFNKYYFHYTASYSNFKLDNFENLFNKSIGKRSHLRSSIGYPITNSYGYVKPRVQLDVLSYNDLKYSSQGVFTDRSKHKSRVIPILDVKSGLYLDKFVNNNWHQTLEPNIYYLYVPKVSQDRFPVFDSKFVEYGYRQLFLDNRYSGLDRISDAHQITLGAKTSLRQSDGEEKMTFAVARARYFNNLTPYLQENVTFGKWSPIAFLLTYNVSPRWKLEADLIMEKLNKVRNSFLNWQYKLADDRILNVGYQYSRFSLVSNHQLQTSAIWAIRDEINLLGKLDYDLNKKRVSYSLAGVEFNSCCMGLRLAMAKSLLNNSLIGKSKYNNKFLAQIIFKGFTDLGSLEDNYLAGKIPGYKFTGQF